MRLQRKPDGYELQVGDKIFVTIGRLNLRTDVVTRVTKTMAICEKSDWTKPVRYPRKYGFWFYALPYRTSNLSYQMYDEVSE